MGLSIKDWVFVKTAGSWGYLPLSGDGPLDLLSDVEAQGYDHPKAGLFRWFSSIDNDPNYKWNAIGVWNAVVDSPYKDWVCLFEPQAPFVQQMARCLLRDSKWVSGWDHPDKILQAVRIYAEGGRVDYKEQFNPNNAWYICRAEVTRADRGLRLIAELKNRETGKTALASDIIDTPIAFCEDYDVTVDSYGWNSSVYVTAVRPPPRGLDDDDIDELVLPCGPKRKAVAPSWNVRSRITVRSFDASSSYLSLSQDPWEQYQPDTEDELLLV